jgi:hypothetical protein
LVLSPLFGNRADALSGAGSSCEAFYPRIRHETNPESAAEVVARFLRERVLVRVTDTGSKSIPEIWASGATDAAGFERIYTAALRSVGIAARMGKDGRAELLSGGQWRPAPRPFVEVLAPKADLVDSKRTPAP